MIFTEPPVPGPTPSILPCPPSLASILDFVKLLAFILYLGLCVGRLGALLWQGLWVDALATLCLAVTLWSVWRLVLDLGRVIRRARPWR